MVFDVSHVGSIVRIVIAVFVGLPALWMASRALSRFLSGHTSTHISMLVGNIVLYVGSVLLGVSILHDLGFNLSALLGAAGIIGIAVGFAAQTSVANIISGLFLVLEGSCSIGDQIVCDSSVGIIESIDLLSVKVRTIDNTFVRIPNEFFIKKVMVNKTYYQTHIVSFKLGVPIDCDLSLVARLLQEVIVADDLFLHKLAPKITLFEVSSSYVAGYETACVLNELKVDIWVKKGTANKARDAFVAGAQRRLHADGIRATIARL
ncbi:MAG: mechanosensitive ion channel [Candidatus Dependentiae bacterium]|nr:mechanosensitive ion channel [Candidatus Dependentiae bacterium]